VKNCRTPGNKTPGVFLFILGLLLTNLKTKMKNLKQPQLKKKYPVLSLNDFKQVFDTRLEEHLDQRLIALKNISDNKIIGDTLDQTVKIITSGGKRLRPYLVYLSAITADSKVKPEMWSIAIAVELLHSFALIHDDIIDQSSERHNQKTIHRYLKDKLSDKDNGDKEHVGISLAILSGDLIFSWSHNLIQNQDNLDVKEIFQQMVDEVVVGQMLDVTITLDSQVESELIERKNELKTARYSFINPMLIGQALSNSKHLSKFFTGLGLKLGQAFQIQDDIIDVIGDSAKTGKGNFMDVSDGQHTSLSQHVILKAEQRDKKEFLSLWGQSLTPENKSRLRRIFTDSGAVEQGQETVNELIDQALNLIESNQDIRPRVQEHWLALIEKIKQRDK